MGLNVFVALLANGVGAGAALGAVYGTFGALAIRIGASLLLNTAIAALTKRKPSQQDLKRDLSFPTSRPAKRYAYGEFRSSATVLPYPVVGEYAYACWLINSRPSEGDFTIFLDNREVALAGNPYDLSGSGGATATNEPFLNHVKVWIGRGDQTQPPQQFLDEAGYAEGGDELLWRPSDAGAGLTMVWVRLRAGANGERGSRWPSPVPLLEVEGRFSKVFDPRAGGQNITDPETWSWSDNTFLCALDLARTNPFRPYEARNLALDTWSDAATAADELVPLLAGGSERRYRIAGVVVFDGDELEGLMEPVIATGAGRLTRIGGQLGVVAGVPRASVVEVDDSLEGMSFSRLIEDRDLITELRVTYSPSERGGEPGELIPWEIPGAIEADGGQPSVITLDLSMVSSATQAQRIRNIVGKKSRLQNRLALVAPPACFTATAGAVVSVGLPSPYGSKMNGAYEVLSMNPMFDPVGAEGFALRCPLRLSEYSDDVYAWDAAMDEEPIVHPDYTETRNSVAPVGPITATTGETVNGTSLIGGVLPRVKYTFDQSSSSGVERYEVQIREAAGSFSESTFILADQLSDGDPVEGYFTGVPGTLYDLRVRTIAAAGQSIWTGLTGLTPVVTIALDVPADGAATGGSGLIEVTFLAPNQQDVVSVEVWASDTDDVLDAVLLANIFSGPNTAVSTTDTALGAAVTRYYFGRTRGNFASASAFTASVFATTDA